MDIPKTSLEDACRICRYPAWSDDPGDERMCENFEELQTSSTKGCLGCSVLVKAWEYGTPDKSNRKQENITFNPCSARENLYVHLFKSPGVLDIDFFTISGSPLFKHIRPAALIPPTTHLPGNLGMIKNWLHTCENLHSTCSKHNTEIPPRLLDLGIDETSDIIRLVDKEELQRTFWVEDLLKDFQYVCLSHCWGQTRHKHLTRESNLKDNLNGIPICDLPRTFRDAITVSRALSLRYLWIDSLTIVQDDHADWKMHVSKMAEIYQNAYITLAAGASEDDDGGFFHQASSAFTPPSSFKLHDGNLEHEIYIRKCLPHPDEGWPTGQELPLMNRGWVFQERLLSRRFLCFAANEILWECQEEVACSCSTTADGFSHHHATNPAFLNCPPSKYNFAKLGELPKEELWDLWQQLTTQYTRRELTFPGDKLPALAGLVQKFRPFMESDYLGGIWIQYIEQGILWQNLGHSSNEFRPREAPSWSWVSAADGGIDWQDSLRNCPTTYLNLTERTDFPSQSDGSCWDLLSVRGPLWHVSLLEEEITNGMETFQGYRCCSFHEHTSTKSLRQTKTIDSPQADTMTASGFQAGDQPSGSFWADYKFWTSDESLWDILGNVFFLEMGTEIDEFFGGDIANCFVVGLVLRTTDRDPIDGVTVYERIGWFRFGTHRPSAEWKSKGVMSKILIA